MKSIKWTKALSVGISRIDKQHRQFIGLINKTKKALQAKKEGGLGDIIKSLIEFVRLHFSAEEEYFAKWDYPYADEHIIEHEKLIIDTLRFDARCRKGEKILPELMDFLVGWFETHLKTHDFKYRDYFKEKGYT